MSLLGFQLYTALIILMGGMVTVRSFPMRRVARTTSSTADPQAAVEISVETVAYLTSISRESKSLFTLMLRANQLANEDVLKTNVSG